MKKDIIFILIIIIIIDINFSILRNYRRENNYLSALNHSIKSDKKLLVIGNPTSGFWNKHINCVYGYGDVCLDLNGCDCSKSIKGDILNELKNMNNNEYVIFESCVLEYVNKDKINEINNEIMRVSGGDYYYVRIFPNIFPINFPFIENG